jgi:tripartite ATP-independent transporter DctM subunit
MAQVCATTGISRDLYELASKWLGRFSGGVAMATIMACALFAAMSGSAVACAATIGAIAIPEMKRLGYSDNLSTGVVATGGTLGCALPPSFQFILFGILTETSIGKLFTAALIPGILQAVFYMVAIYIVCKRNPDLGPPGPPSSFKEKMIALGRCGEILALVVLVMGGIAVGWFTPPRPDQSGLPDLSSSLLSGAGSIGQLSNRPA